MSIRDRQMIALLVKFVAFFRRNYARPRAREKSVSHHPDIDVFG